MCVSRCVFFHLDDVACADRVFVGGSTRMEAPEVRVVLPQVEPRTMRGRTNSSVERVFSTVGPIHRFVSLCSSSLRPRANVFLCILFIIVLLSLFETLLSYLYSCPPCLPWNDIAPASRRYAPLSVWEISLISATCTTCLWDWNLCAILTFHDRRRSSDASDMEVPV